jgi:hypothetical protein
MGLCCEIENNQSRRSNNLTEEIKPINTKPIILLIQN